LKDNQEPNNQQPINQEHNNQEPINQEPINQPKTVDEQRSISSPAYAASGLNSKYERI